MGSTQSTSDNTAKKYTDAEIRQNIQKLFTNNRENNFSEASYSIRDLENMVVSDGPFNQSNNMEHLQLGGDLSNIKFKSSKNRHLTHDIDAYLNMYQKGGNAENSEHEYLDLSSVSEFKKIKDFLVTDNNINNINNINNQNGGEQFDAFIDSVSSIQQNKLTFFDALKQITQNGGVDISDDDDDMYGDSDDMDDDNVYMDDGITTSSSDNSSYNKITSSNSTFSTTSSMMPKYSGNFSETSYSQSNTNNASNTSTSYSNNASSELNIVPFYSSSESDMRHPYTKNRFN